MTDALAAVCSGAAGRIELREFPIPEPIRGEILVRVSGCRLCGSDRHSFEARRQVAVPTVLGHEIVGTIVAFGDSASRRDLAGNELRRGDRITWAIVASCGNCFYCLRELPQKCLNAVKYGHEKLSAGRELRGGLADHCLLAPGTSIVRLPDDLPLEVACPASCATATVAAALEGAGLLTGRSICIFGAGMLGLTACAMSRSRGAARVVCVDPQPARLEQALRFGATHAVQDLHPRFQTQKGSVDFNPHALPAAQEPLPQHGFDVVVELSGNPEAFIAAWPALRIGGRLILVGSVFPAPPVPIALEEVVRRQITIQGVHNDAPRHLRAAVDFLAAHHREYPFVELVAGWLPLESVAEAIARSGDASVVRIGVRPSGGKAG